MKVGFYLTWGGIGDFIMYAPGIKYAMDANKHLYGYLFVPPFFYDLAKLWFGEKYDDRFQLIQTTTDPNDDKRFTGTIIVAPNGYQIANSHVVHTHKLGFIYYSQTPEHLIPTLPEEYLRLLPIKGDEANIWKFQLPKRYAVIPIMSTSKCREMKSSTINEIKDYLVSIGITPVYIGKKFLTDKYSAWDKESELDFDGVLDLREKTDLPEVACIMAKAEMVIGMDCGMLHLANCSNVPTIWMFTSVSPDLRLVERDAPTMVITPNECRFCESDFTKFFPEGVDKKECIFKDFKCLNFEMTIIRTAIEKVLEYAKTNV